MKSWLNAQKRQFKVSLHIVIAAANAEDDDQSVLIKTVFANSNTKGIMFMPFFER